LKSFLWNRIWFFVVLRHISLVTGILLFLHAYVRKNNQALASNSDFSVGWPLLL
jgi:hypothetical protein